MKTAGRAANAKRAGRLTLSSRIGSLFQWVTSSKPLTLNMHSRIALAKNTAPVSLSMSR